MTAGIGYGLYYFLTQGGGSAILGRRLSLTRRPRMGKVQEPRPTGTNEGTSWQAARAPVRSNQNSIYKLIRNDFKEYGKG